MRIIAGNLRGRRLASFKNSIIRPTSDRIREAVFNILNAKNFCAVSSPPLEVLDLFSGTGAMGIEALSRGALRSTFVENDTEALKLLKKNLETFDLKGRALILPLESYKALTLLKREKKLFDLVFLDPPYNMALVESTLKKITDNGLLTDNAIVVAEHSLKEIPKETLDDLTLEERRRYGATVVSFYSVDNQTTTPEEAA